MIAASKRAKPFPGHKRGAVSRGFAVSCECGWRSGVNFGRGGMAGANHEWRYHVEQHRKVAAGEIPCACGGSKRPDGVFIHNNMDGCRKPPEAT